MGGMSLNGEGEKEEDRVESRSQTPASVPSLLASLRHQGNSRRGESLPNPLYHTHTHTHTYNTPSLTHTH